MIFAIKFLLAGRRGNRVVTTLRLVFLFLASCLLSLQVSAQASDLSKIKVDQMTNEQVSDMYEQLKSTGLSDREIYSSLSKRGLPVAELAKFKARVDLLSGSTNVKTPDVASQRRTVTMGVDSASRSKDSLADLEKKIFGYRIFHNANANANFTPNLNMATPQNYVVGPGDVLLLQVYGIAQSSYNLTVSPEGNVTIPDIGISHVGGLSIAAVKATLRDKLAIRYSGMRGSNPNTFLEVTLGNIRSIKINMVGEISTPGSYTLPSYVTIFNALYVAGGPTIRGSFRSVQVFRGGRMVADIDLYDFLVNGKTNQNIRMEDNDVVLVKPAINRVELVGEIRIPGIFELKPRETFNDLMKFSGGFSNKAYEQIVSVTRNGPTEKQIFDLNASQFPTAVLTDGDVITVGAILERYSNRVQISGAVNRPGAFELTNGMTARDLIQAAGGLKGDAFLQRALIYRTKADFSQEVVSIDLSRLTDPASAASIKLQREDVLSVASVYDLKEEYYVQISGEVNKTGIFPYADSMTISELIFKAGGFKYSASGSFVEIARRSINEPGKVAEILRVSVNKDLSLATEGQAIYLRPFDHVFVRSTPGFQSPKAVIIQGEVQYPGTYTIEKKEMRISDLLTRAGGVSKYAYLKGATLLRRTKSFNVITPTEQENLNLLRLKASLAEEKGGTGSEVSDDLEARIDAKIRQNQDAIEKEKDLQDKSVVKQGILRNNAAVLASGAAAEKEQELVAIDFEKIQQAPGSSADLVLKEGDILDIPEILETVKISGAVLYPVSVRYDPTLKFRDYVNLSGGFSSKAIRNQAYVLQANGRVERSKHFLFFRTYPKIEPGAEVYVPVSTSERTPFSVERTVGIITSALTLIFLLRTL